MAPKQNLNRKNRKKKKIEIGLGLTIFGVLLTALGVMFFFDKALLTMGNVIDQLASFLLLFFS